MPAEGARVLDEHRVACIITPSLREICKLFAPEGENPIHLITKLKARASIAEGKQLLIEDKKFGIKGEFYEAVKSIKLNYTLKWEDGTPTNLLDEEGIRVIEECLHKLSIDDAAVEMVEVLIRDPKLGKLAKVPEEEFYITLNSDPPDGELDRKEVTDLKVNRDLIKDNKFKHRLLNTRKLMAISHKLAKKRKEKKHIIFWGGKTALSLNSPIKIAKWLKNEHFGENGRIKKYGVEAEDNLVLLSIVR